MNESFFISQKNDDQRTYDNIRKTATSQGDYYTTGCLLKVPYSKEHYKMTAIDLSKKTSS